MGLPVEHGVLFAPAGRFSSASSAAPVSSGRPRTVQREADGVWLVATPEARVAPSAGQEPGRAPARGPGRIIGPGRKERSYRERIDELDLALGGVRGELETARLVERGSQRLIDRVEADLGRQRDETRTLRQAQARLALGLGVVQSENEALRSENEALHRRVALLDAPARPSWFARLLGR